IGSPRSGRPRISTEGGPVAIGESPTRARNLPPPAVGITPGTTDGEGSVVLGDQTGPDREPDEPGDVVDVEPLHDPHPVGLDRLDAEVEDLRDLLGRLPLGDQLQDLALPVRERVERTGLVPAFT